ncbi:MORC family CW-type zinc finger protein 3 isoform X1 [Hippoglossus hippoglossus]|uniref:MORC family CW-type zinc finger protein 3 isoform X1 n=1 Tax=Hippoglossus hippoglossus TaxID=8267 RepID=UPI00148BCA81|nr:MORC family CW-type zinc finger protein 3 isoform X1 [Hippoglossus hippoglossus]
MSRLSEHGIRLSSMSPSFLNSNSTSHTWPFSAVAELIDNASDPGVTAKQIWIDVVEDAGHLCLTFIDNGSGMTPNKLHKMLSFGFTEKGSGKASLQAIGLYGNGFKSGSMRLGRDALIFTKNGGCQSVGMLSQTYLENVKAQAIIVPIVPFNQQTKSLVLTEDSEASLAAILQHSIVSTQEQIQAHFASILSKKGTKILIWNIRRAKDGKPEIDFETDVSDFRLPEIQIEEMKKGLRSSGSLRTTQNIPDMHFSLQAYLSILYLRPRIQIILRGKKIISTVVSQRLIHTEHDVYKPHFSKEKVKVTFGLNLKSKDHYGILMYHKNRLIKAYEKVGCQLKGSGQRAGVGVIGIIECNFLKPAHNKQDFEYTKEYRLTLGALGLKLNDYWKEVTEKMSREEEFQALDSREEKEDEQDADEGPKWLQCEECLKWRSVPMRYYSDVPERWDCSQNPNPRYRSCSSPEEGEESEEMLSPSYQKNHKKQFSYRDHPKSRKRERSEEVCDFRDQVVKHQILSRCSSEPIQLTYHSTQTDRYQKKENTHEDDQTNTDHHTDRHTSDEAQTQNRGTAEHPLAKQKSVVRVRGKKDKGKISQGREETDRKKDADVETVEREEENTDTLRGVIDSCDPIGRVRVSVGTDSIRRLWLQMHNMADPKRKPGLWEEQPPDSENMAEEVNPEKPACVSETLSSEKTNQDSCCRMEKPGDTGQETPLNLTWTRPLPSTQTRPLHLRESEQEATVQKLSALEKEVQELRKLLGRDTKKSRGTMAAPASREVGCQMDTAESSASSSRPALTLPVQGHGAVCGLREQHEQSRLRKEKTEAQSKTRVGDCEPCEDSRSAQENLRCVRHNMVVLLTALLPQLDLAGISLESTDVDDILQQIIEVNSLKL